MSTTEQLLSDFIDAWNAGQRPRVREYLARLPDGPERGDLADQITSWLEIAPTPDYDEPTRTAIRAEPLVAHLLASADGDAGLWPTLVPALRERAGLSLADLATKLVERFALDRKETTRTAGYLERLEHGALDPTRVSRRLLDALGAILGIRPATLSDSAAYGHGLRPAATAGGAIFRAAAPAAAAPARDQLRGDIEALSRAARRPAPPPLDDLDRLFIGGPDA
jgi:transcriptional regulator with XRE-family HTH domain